MEYLSNNECKIENYDFDEIKHFFNTRWVSRSEAMYRLLKYPSNQISHVIYKLAVCSDDWRGREFINKWYNNNL